MAETVAHFPSPAGGLQFKPPVAISAAHDVSGFSCRKEPLNEWLKKHAVKNEIGGVSRTYVVEHAGRVVSYYSLAAGGIGREAMPTKLRRDTPPIVPVVVLGRLATDRPLEGRGLGGDMLSEAVSRMLTAANEIGVRALLVHAIDDEAVGFYRKYSFVPTPIGDRTLLLPVETARQAFLAK